MTATTFQAYRWRIFGLVLLAFLPLLALNLYTSFEQRANILEQDRQKVLMLTHLATAEHTSHIQSIHDLMTALGELVTTNSRDPAACVKTLQVIQRQNPSLANMGMVEPNGDLYCSVARLGTKTNIADRNYFQRAMREKNFVIGEYQIGRIINKPVLPVAKPILDSGGQVKRVLFATLDLLWLNQSLANVQLPPGATILLLDRQGTVLARHPEPQQWVGKMTTDTSLVKTVLNDKQGVALTTGLDGVERVYGFSSLGGRAADQVYLAVGLASGGEQTKATAVLLRNLLIAVMTGILSLTAGWWLINRDLREHEMEGAKTSELNKKLQDTVQLLELRERDERLLSQMRNQFQIGQTDEEIHKIIADHFSRIFPECAGALYLINASRRLVEPAIVWGQQPPHDAVFHPQDCLALRRGQIYTHDSLDGSFSCAHVPNGNTRQYVCLPLLAHGEMLGTVHLLWDTPRDGDVPSLASKAADLDLAGTVCGIAALALAHSRLLQTLKIQAMRDPLTGLFNRRYMEETLERELARGRRNHIPLSVIMMDVDHFKQFNDRYGHAAGDTVLAEIGSLLLKSARASDIACRYGGEELFLIMPDCELDCAQKHAQQLLHQVRSLEIRQNEQDLGRITISQGIAVFPQHANNAEQLLQAADAALYRAKQEGRDRVVVSDPTATTPPRSSA